MILLYLFAVQALMLAGAGLELPKGSCAFEESTCGYESDLASLPWNLNGEGHFISVDTSQGTNGDIAVLLSPELYTEEWSCIRLIYQIARSSESSVDPTALNVYLRVEGESFDHLLWTTTERSESWLIASLDLRNRTDKYRIVLEGVLGRDILASIAIFEIKITTGYCIECNFEENHLCGFMNRWNPNVNWFVGGGNIGNSQPILPRDHTLNNEFDTSRKYNSPQPHGSPHIMVPLYPGIYHPCHYFHSHYPATPASAYLRGTDSSFQLGKAWGWSNALRSAGPAEKMGLILQEQGTEESSEHRKERKQQGHYMYVDSLYVKHFQEVAQLVSPRTTTPMSGCLSFYYIVQQQNGIAFTIYMKDINGFYEELWKAPSSMSNDWILGEADFSAPYPMEVIFEVAFNSASGGYIALDDISFSPVFCSNQTEISFSPTQVSCSFEEDLCNFYQDHKDGPGWSRVKVKPNAYRPGDRTTGTGYYLMANTKFTSHPGYIGRLYSPTLPGNLQYCLRFYYAIHGFFKMRDTLAIYIFEENHVVQEKIWSVSETPRGVWTQAEITFRKPMPCKVVFVSWCRSFWDCGLVALDDVSVTLGNCQVADTFPSECTFDRNECGFTQQKRNRGVWHRRRGQTPTSYTGPKADHTTGVGSYMYIEASHMIYGQKARLMSRLLRRTFGYQCLIFFYHMYGTGTGLLNVYLKKHGAKDETLIWKRRGEQGITWLRGQIQYTCDKSHQIIFEAIRGLSVRSDIAIDDILFQRGSCKEMGETTLQSSGYSADFNEIEY